MTDPELAIVRGRPLAEEEGLGTLTLPGLLREVTERYPSREALVMRHPDGTVERWSYRDLAGEAMAVAKALAACGLGRNERVGILMTNRLEWVSGCFGISLAGGTVTGLSTFSTAAELEHLVRASGISILLYEPRVLAKDFTAMLLDLEPQIATAMPGRLESLKFPHLRRLVALGETDATGVIESWADFLSRGKVVSSALIDARADTVKPSDPSLLFFSSGSTGKPKGILNAHRGVAIQCWRYPGNYRFDHPVRTWSANGLFWSGNFALALGGTLAGGGTLVLQPTFDPAEAIRLMELERVTLPYCWPHQWAQLEAEPSWDEADLSSLYYLDTERNLRRKQKSIATNWLEPRASYGATETFTLSASFAVGTPRQRWEGSHGEALPGNTIKIVDPDTGRILRRGETGEIAVKGPTLMLGYIGIPNDEALDSEGFYRSGDGGHLDECGRLFFAGRINDIIKSGGANVSPVEVDWALAACPGVKVCKTTGVPHDTLGEMVVSLIVPEAGAQLVEETAMRHLKQQLASYKVPRRILLVSEEDLNLTGTAKIKPAEARAVAVRRMAALEAQMGSTSESLAKDEVMQITTATATVNEMGPLRKIVNAFCEAQAKVLAAGVKSPSDWAPMAEYLAVDEFKRVGAYLEELDYSDYCDFLTAWAAGGTRFEMTEFHVTEVGNTLFQEIEERHWRGDNFIRKNVIAVYRFNADNKIIHLDIYEQAKDSGRWIIEAAETAMA